MKIFENKSIFKKLIIVLLVIMLFSFCMPKTVRAEDGVGGKLLNPVMSLFVGLGDGAMAILQKIIFHSDNSLINIDTSADFWSKFIVIASAVLLAAVAIVACIFTGGGAAVVALGIIKITLVTGVITTITFPLTTSLVEGMLPESFYLPLYSITPQEIFSNKIPLLDVDFFNPTDSIELEDGTTMESTAYQLKNTVANWYIILRDISLVALLSVLVYIGIRILISSTSSDKAKYKQMLVDWMVAICLLFAIHYIMSFSNLLVEKVIDIIDSTQINAQEEDTEVKEPEMYEITDTDVVDKAYETLVEKPAEDGEISSEEDSPYYAFFVDDNDSTAGSDSTKLLWPAENFMQQARINLQLLEDDTETYVAIGWKLIYVVLVIFTLIFVFTYLKRLVYMTFLTIIAPLVALTYPIDKINDGKAQAFNMWFKEYIFNLLIQPMHLILYTILISSAMDFASQNALYVVVALGFMIPAEKLMRSFFGFEKAKTPGLLGGPAGAALMMSGMNKLFGRGPKGGKGVSGGTKEKIGDNGQENGKAPRMDPSFDKESAMIGSMNLENNLEGGPGDLKNRNNDLNEGLGIEDNKNKFESPYNSEKSNGINDNLGLDNRLDTNSQDINNYQNDNNIKLASTPLKGNQQIAEIKPKKSIRRAMIATAKYTGRGFKNPEVWKTVGKTAVRGATKGVIRGAGIAVGGTAGAIAGIVSGDASKFTQYTATGAIGGYTTAKNISVPKFPENEDLKEQVQRAYYGSEHEYNNAIQKQYIKDFKKNEKNMIKLENKYGTKEAKQIMDDVVPDYLNAGISNIDDIMAAYQLEKNGTVENRDMAAATVKYASRIGSDTRKMKKKDRDDWQKTISSEFSKNERVKKSNNANTDDMANTVLRRIDAFNKAKND